VGGRVQLPRLARGARTHRQPDKRHHVVPAKRLPRRRRLHGPVGAGRAARRSAARRRSWRSVSVRRARTRRSSTCRRRGWSTYRRARTVPVLLDAVRGRRSVEGAGDDVRRHRCGPRERATRTTRTTVSVLRSCPHSNGVRSSRAQTPTRVPQHSCGPPSSRPARRTASSPRSTADARSPARRRLAARRPYPPQLRARSDRRARQTRDSSAC
jgi:hypothetical protein